MSGFKFPEIITYWSPTGRAIDGEKTWAAGVAIAARVADKISEVITSDGKEVITSKAVYSKVSIPVSAYISIGDFDGAAAPDVTAKRVLKQSEIVSMTDAKMVLI